MLQVSVLREQTERVKDALRLRHYNEDFVSKVDDIIAMDDDRKKFKTAMDDALAQSNALSKEIGELFKSGNAEAANAKKAEVAALKEEAKKSESDLKSIKEEIESLLLSIPNIPHSSVPKGKTDEDNAVEKDWDQPLPDLGSDALPHWDLAEKYNLIDFKLGVKIAGSGFPLFRGKGAQLQRAMINFFLDEAREAGYEEVMPPLLVNADTARGTGALPDKEGQMYHCEKDEFYLLPTAEVPVTNIVRGDIVDASTFPIKFCSHTPCFRREAGSYGSDVKGLNRVHQFEKVEIVQIQHPDKSYETLDEMLRHVEQILQKLELPYRILRLCSGDLTFTSSLTFDFEVYSAAQKKWLEVSSVSNFETYQANRLNCRFKDENGKKHLVHTLNGSALALARIVAAVLENNQTKDGIIIPEVLRPYTKFDVIK